MGGPGFCNRKTPYFDRRLYIKIRFDFKLNCTVFGNFYSSPINPFPFKLADQRLLGGPGFRNRKTPYFNEEVPKFVDMLIETTIC